MSTGVLRSKVMADLENTEKKLKTENTTIKTSVVDTRQLDDLNAQIKELREMGETHMNRLKELKMENARLMKENEEKSKEIEMEKQMNSAYKSQLDSMNEKQSTKSDKSTKIKRPFDFHWLNVLDDVSKADIKYENNYDKNAVLFSISHSFGEIMTNSKLSKKVTDTTFNRVINAQISLFLKLLNDE